MPKVQVIVEFDVLVDQTLSRTHLHNNDRIELASELKQHLYDHYQELVEQKMTHESAIKQTIDQFGNPRTIQKRINQTYPNTLREFILRELIILIILITAIVIGPLLLINRYRFESMLGVLPVPFVILGISGLFRHFVLNKVKSWKVQITLTILIYIALMMSMINQFSGQSLSFVLNELSLFRITNYVNGSDGIVTLQTLHVFWVLVLIIQRFKSKLTLTIKQRMISSSYQYWSLILLGFCITFFVPSNSEFQLVFINVFLITSFLEVVLSDNLLILISKQFTTLVNRDLKNNDSTTKY